MFKKIVTISFLLALTLGASHTARASLMEPTVTASPGAKDVEDIALTRRAERAFRDLQAGKIDRSQFSASVLKVLTPDAVAQVSHMLDALGAVRALHFVKIQIADDGAQSSLYSVVCKKGKINYEFGLDTQGKVNVFAFE